MTAQITTTAPRTPAAAPASTPTDVSSITSADYVKAADAESLTQTLLASGMTREQIARVALFRFGLGPRRGSPVDLNTLDATTGAIQAIQQCITELAASDHLITRVDARLSDANCFMAAAGFNAGDIRYEEMSLRYINLMKPKVGFAERLVLFWSNHFSMAMDKSVPLQGSIGHFERKVIRPNIKSNFSRMLGRAISHPAMIGYLDNDNSTKSAINQNLAREILELHTLGAGSNLYDEDSVIALSRMLTGWNVNYEFVPDIRNGVQQKDDKGRAVYKHGPDYGKFQFYQTKHDENPQVMCKRNFTGAGQRKVAGALYFLANYVDTAEHLAFKLIQHFVKDNPDVAMVDSLKSAFTGSKGDLNVLATTLLLTPAAWKEPLQRIRPPHLWLVAQARALGCNEADFIFRVQRPDFIPTQMESKTNRRWSYVIEGYWVDRLRWLNNAPWNRLTPDGYPDQDSAWLDPNSMRIRLMIPNTLFNDFTNRRSQYTDLQFAYQSLPTAQDVARSAYINATGDLAPGNFSGAGDAQTIARQKLADVFLSSDFMCR